MCFLNTQLAVDAERVLADSVSDGPVQAHAALRNRAVEGVAQLLCETGLKILCSVSFVLKNVQEFVVFDLVPKKELVHCSRKNHIFVGTTAKEGESGQTWTSSLPQYDIESDTAMIVSLCYTVLFVQLNLTHLCSRKGNLQLRHGSDTVEATVM